MAAAASTTQTDAKGVPSYPQLKGQTIVVLGATGIVASGVVHAALEAGAAVIAVGRTQSKLDALKASLQQRKATLITATNFHTVAGSYGDEKAVRALHAAVTAAAGKGGYQHVVASLGFINMSNKGVSESPLSELKAAFDDSLYPNFLTAAVFLPPLKSIAGASYTIASGGFAHGAPLPGIWPGTVKNAALNGLGLSLFKEYENAAVRVNVACVHFGVAPIGGEKNQIGFPGADTTRVGPVFLSLAAGKRKGAVHCVETVEDGEKLAHTLLK